MLPLHLAALNAHADCCKKLLASGTCTVQPTPAEMLSLDMLSSAHLKKKKTHLRPLMHCDLVIIHRKIN